MLDRRVEILKLLHRGVRILILDEPTSVLTPQESQTLFGAIRAMREDGKGKAGAVRPVWCGICRTETGPGDP